MDNLLEGFLQLAKGNDKNLSMEELLTDEEKFEWETLVKAMDSIDILNVGKDLEKIEKMFSLKRWQDLSILAYVKLLELMIKKAKESGVMDGLSSPPKKKQPKIQPEYSGSMFG